jgi:hypothetical protein
LQQHARGDPGERERVAQARRKRLPRLQRERGAAERRFVDGGARLRALRVGARQRQRAGIVAARVARRADVDEELVRCAEDELLQRMRAVGGEALDHGLGSDRQRRARPPDARRLADVDATVAADRDAVRPVELVGDGAQHDWRRRAARRQLELEQPAAVRLPAAHVDDPEAPRRDFDDAARKDEAARLVGDERDAPAARHFERDARNPAHVPAVWYGVAATVAGAASAAAAATTSEQTPAHDHVAAASASRASSIASP